MKTHPHLELTKKYARSAARAALSPDEKAKMRENLIEHIKASPTALSMGAPDAAPRVSSPYAKYLKRAGRVVAPLMLVIIIGGGTSYAAESSLPGDLLYPVKIHVNENVVSDFSFTALSQAQWAVQKVKRRLAEAKAIGLQAAAKVGLDNAVVTETDDADAKIAALDAADPADAGQLTEQLADLLQDDGIDASTSPIDVSLSTSTDTTSNQVSNKIHTVKSDNSIAVPVVNVAPISAKPATSPVISAPEASSGGVNVTTNTNASVGTAANVNTNVNVTVPSVPAVSTPTITTPVVSAPAVTVPAVTVPSVTVPSVSVPSAAASAVSSVKSGLSL